MTTHGVTQGHTQLPKRLISEKVAERVIDPFEVIDINDSNSEVQISTPRHLTEFIKRRLELPTVENIRQLIYATHPFKFTVTRHGCQRLVFE